LAQEEWEEDERFNFDSDDDYLARRNNKKFPGMWSDSKEDKKVFEADLRAEYKRIFARHRIDFAKMYFEKDGGYTLREFKKIMKIEIEENPERYTIQSPNDRKKQNNLDKVRNEAESQGPIFFDMPQERLDLIK